MKPSLRLLAVAIVAAASVALGAPSTAAAEPAKGRAPKVLIDTDFNTIGDDGQVLAMAAQLHAAGAIELLGITVASGNQWLDQGVADALKAVERLGLDRKIEVHAGQLEPLLHDDRAYRYETLLTGDAIDYVGAFAAAPGGPLVAPPDGFAQHTRLSRQDAVDHIIETVRRYPHEVSILEIAPPTNLALAIRKDPGIVPLIKQVVTMAGQVYAPGNAYLDNAEFNWWFDPEATQIVLRAAIPHVVIPLDCTNTVPLTKAVYQQIAGHQPATAITRLFADAYAPFFGSGPAPYAPYIFDTLALAYLVDPSFATETRDLWLDVSTTFDRNYGKSVVYLSEPYPSIPLLQRSTVVFRFDNARFYAFYADLLTRSVPVR